MLSVGAADSAPFADKNSLFVEAFSKLFFQELDTFQLAYSLQL
jgi:hypothetical protein